MSRLCLFTGFDPAEETFGEQKELADRYRVVLVDRRGYGESPASDRLDFDAQVEDIMRVVGEGAHLVGQSYGGLAVSAGRGRAPASGVDANRD